MHKLVHEPKPILPVKPASKPRVVVPFRTPTAGQSPPS
jgi:hypothetical protein